MKKSVFEIATNRMIALLESGTNPWRKPWRTSNRIPPMNYSSKRAYSGINFFLLSMLDDPFFMTFKQIEAKGGKVRKGAKGEIVFFWLWTFYDAKKRVTKDEKQAVKKIPSLRYYRVFNARDIEGIDFEYPTVEPLKENKKIEKIEAAIKATGAKIQHKGDQAYYSIVYDHINMPVIGRFENSDFYYSTLFHELGHWTGTKKRLDREICNSFGDAKYSKEELVAEMTSAFLCSKFGIDNNELTHNSAAYLKGWIQALQGNSKLIITAATAAKKAFNFLDEKMQEIESIAA